MNPPNPAFTRNTHYGYTGNRLGVANRLGVSREALPKALSEARINGLLVVNQDGYYYAVHARRS